MAAGSSGGLQVAKKKDYLPFRAQRGISLRFNDENTKKEKFLDALGMTKP
jgi:hypothetical protein